jgi:hypothetical protein
MHYNVMPTISLVEAKDAILVLAGYLRGGSAAPDLGCVGQAACVVGKYGFQVYESGAPIVNLTTGPSDKAAILESAAAALGSGTQGVGAVPWLLIIEIVIQILQAVHPLIPKG